MGWKQRGTVATNIPLDADEALVLFDFLTRNLDGEDKGKLDSLFAHHAESLVFTGLLADLERQLAEPFRQDYEDLVQQARLKLMQRYGEA
jgi:hypothetical protein